MRWSRWLSHKLAALSEAKLERTLIPYAPVVGRPNRVLPVAREPAHSSVNTHSTIRRAAWAGDSESPTSASTSELLLFASNDYLGLSTHPKVREAAAAAAAVHGCGPRASPLVCGYTREHAALEDALAALKGTETALLFPTGYAANMAVLGVLADSSEAAIFSDALNHASIVDGARLAAKSGAELHVYAHKDVEQLRSLLASSTAPRKLIVSDSLFSMDGDAADCDALAHAAEEHGAILCLDEAHATLVFGDGGGGIAEAQGVSSRVDVHVGTLSKAFGSHGGFVACSTELKRLLLSRGRPGIFSTALPAPTVAAAFAAIAAATPNLRRKLWRNVELFEKESGVRATSPIIPVILGSESSALAASAALLSDGFLVPAIRPPTVPRGTARLRVALSAAHDEDDVVRLAARLRPWLTQSA